MEKSEREDFVAEVERLLSEDLDPWQRTLIGQAFETGPEGFVYTDLTLDARRNH